MTVQPGKKNKNSAAQGRVVSGALPFCVTPAVSTNPAQLGPGIAYPSDEWGGHHDSVRVRSGSGRLRLLPLGREEILLDEEDDVMVSAGHQLVSDRNPAGLFGLFDEQAHGPGVGLAPGGERREESP